MFLPGLIIVCQHHSMSCFQVLAGTLQPWWSLILIELKGRSFSMRRSMRVPVFMLLLVGSISAASCGPEVSYRQVAVFVDLTEIEQHEGRTQLQDDAIIEGILNLVTSDGRESSRLDGAYHIFLHDK